MKTKSIKKRVDDLERSSTSHGTIIICRLEGETRDQAIERNVSEGRLTERDCAIRPILVADPDDLKL
jgi:hypothetical protein